MAIQDQPNSETMDERVLKALNHNIRREILLELYEYGLGGYTELAKVLKLKPGAFYHHIRLLEEANLVKQSEDKAYEITYKGYQALEFLRSNLPSIKENRLITLLAFFNPVSKTIESAPIIFLFLQIVIFTIGGVWLAFNYQLSFLGYFILSFGDNISPLLFTFIFSTLGLIGTWILVIAFTKRSMSKISLAAHILVPQTFFILIILVLSVIPLLTQLISLQSVIGFLITIFYQLLGVIYLLHVLQNNNVRAVDKILIGLIVLQYWNLLIIYFFT